MLAWVETRRGRVVSGVVPEDARGNVAATAYGDHKVGLEVIEDALGALLT